MENNLNLFISQWFTIQGDLFGGLEDELGILSPEDEEFVRICTVALKETCFTKYLWCRNGRRPISRVAIFKMLILKALRNYVDTKQTLMVIRKSPVLRRLCGWESVSDIPSESTVSRAFEKFAQDEIVTKLHSKLVTSALGRNGIFHLSHDSSAIEAREKGVRIKQSEDELNNTSLESQRTRSASENFSLLPQHCDWGCKLDSKGKKKIWKGYKLHLCCSDGDIPITGFLSSANMHDSKAIIPMMQKASEDFTYFYDLADAGYDATEIRNASIALNHVPIIDRNPRRGEKNVNDIGGRTVNIIDSTTRRYFQRSSIERVFSHLHDSHGGKFIRVRGHAKVFAHLMFGLIVITVEQIFGSALTL